MNILEKIKIFEKEEYFLKYTLNNENIELIALINELRKKNNIKTLIFNKLQNLKDFFNEQNLANEKYIFKCSFAVFKNKVLKSDENVIKILLKENLKYIIILEKEKNEYIFIYSKHKDIEDIKYIKNNGNAKEKNKLENFHIINNTIPEVNIKESLHITINLNKNISNKSSNFQF